VPNDYDVLRERAKAAMWAQDYTSARQSFGRLTQSSAATREDFESLIHAYVWTGDLAGAQPFAKRLVELDPGNQVALQALRDFDEQQRLMARNRAEELAASGRFTEAVQAYRDYMKAFTAASKSTNCSCAASTVGAENTVRQ